MVCRAWTLQHKMKSTNIPILTTRHTAVSGLGWCPVSNPAHSSGESLVTGTFQTVTASLVHKLTQTAQTANYQDAYIEPIEHTAKLTDAHTPAWKHPAFLLHTSTKTAQTASCRKAYTVYMACPLSTQQPWLKRTHQPQHCPPSLMA
jgi:hypothetical protein